MDKLLEKVLNDGLTLHWWVYVLVLLITTLGGGLGALASGYMKRRGENYATREDFNMLLEQVKQNTRVVEVIKAEIAKGMWLNQSELEFRKRQLAELYGPIYGFLMVSNDLYKLWMEGKLQDINEDILGMFRKNNETIGEMIVKKVHLIDGAEIPECFRKFMTSACIFNFYTARPSEPYVPDTVSALEQAKWPDDFEEYIFTTTERLKTRLDELHRRFSVTTPNWEGT